MANLILSLFFLFSFPITNLILPTIPPAYAADNGLDAEDLKYLKQADIKIVAPTWIPADFRVDRVMIKTIERINIQYAIRWVRIWEHGFKQQYINLVCTKRKMLKRKADNFKEIQTDVWGKVKLYTYGEEFELDTSTITTLNSIKDTGVYYIMSSTGMQYRPRISILEMERIIKSLRVM